MAEHSQILIEGVHVLPDIPSPRLRERAVTVQAMLAVGDEAAHRQRFEARGAQAPRPAARYLEAFDRLRAMQHHLVDQARESGIPVIDEVQTDRALNRMVEVVLDAVGQAAAGDRSSGRGKVQTGDVQ